MNIYINLDKNFIQYKKHNIPIVFDKFDRIWFNAKETASALGYVQTKKVIRTFVPDKDKKQLKNIMTLNKYGQTQSLFLNLDCID